MNSNKGMNKNKVEVKDGVSNGNMPKKAKQEKELTIVTALDQILEKAKDSKLSARFWKSIKKQTDFLKGKLEGFTEFQLVVLAVMIDAGMPMSWKMLGTFFGCSRLTMMTYTEEVDDLIKMRWVRPDASREKNGMFVGYRLERGVVTAIRHNKPFVPEVLDGLSTQTLVDKADRFLHVVFDTGNPEKDYLYDWIDLLVNSNEKLPLCNRMIDLDLDPISKTLFMLVVCDYARYGRTENVGLRIDELEGYLPDDFESELRVIDLKAGDDILFHTDLIEHGCAEGIVNNDVLMLTDQSKAELLADYDLSHGAIVKKDQIRDLKRCDDIRYIPLFYNLEEEIQVGKLTHLLQPSRFAEVQRRLEERGMRKGFACLFYGGPGTGKTETVFQIARQTGRDIMVIEIAGMKDKWVGESEKNIKAVFQRYKKLCKESEITPILFFNESDALINKRNERAESSADKMNNAMQNILLQEMEELEGILIATTNLTETLDKAFERRFLYKIGFKQPGDDVKAKIWQSKIENLSAKDAAKLAKDYNLSGGQIENIARKTLVDYVLYGNEPDFDVLANYSKNEVIDGSNKRANIGFV